MKIKVPVKDLQKKTVGDKIESHLRNDSTNAYTISGLMVEVFEVKKSDIQNKSFSDWPKGVPTLYTKIRSYLEKLVKKGLVNKTMDGRAGVYWWANENEQ